MDVLTQFSNPPGSGIGTAEIYDAMEKIFGVGADYLEILIMKSFMTRLIVA
jgi:hypothetical protein